MKLLFLDSPAFAKQDMLDAFTDCGLSYDLFIHEGYHDRKKLSPMILSFPLTTIRFSRITVKGMESLMLLMSMTVRLSRFIPVP